jgi:hypothetical protein
MFEGDFLRVMKKHHLFLSEDLTGGEDEAFRSGGQPAEAEPATPAGKPGERSTDPETARGNGAATEDTSAGYGFGEATGNSSSAETGLGTLPEAQTNETKGQ